MEVKHGAWSKVRWECHKEQEDPWWDQCVEHSLKIEKDLWIWCSCWLWRNSIDRLAVANSVRWYGHVLRREDGHVSWRELDFEVDGQRKKGRLKGTWGTQVEEESVNVGLRREDALCRLKWSVGVNQIAAGLRWIWPPSLVGDTTRF